MERSDSIYVVDDDGSLIVTWPEKPSIMPVNRPTDDFTVTFYYRCGVDFYPEELITPVEVSVRGNKAYISNAGTFEIVGSTYIYDQGKAYSEYSFSHPTYKYMVFSPNKSRMVLTTTSGRIAYCVD